MIITDQAKGFLLQLLALNRADSIRVYYAGLGWKGPKIDVSLDEPQKEDILEQINGIQVAFEPSIKNHVQDWALEYKKTVKGEGLVLSGGKFSAC